MVSGYRDGDTFPACEEWGSLFQTSYQGWEQACYLCLTQTAPESLKADLGSFFAAGPQESITGILMDTQDPPQVFAGSDHRRAGAGRGDTPCCAFAVSQTTVESGEEPGDGRGYRPWKC